MLTVSCMQEPQAVEQTNEAEVQSLQVPAGSVPGRIRIKMKHEIVNTKAPGLDLSALGNYTIVRTFPPAGKWEARHRAAGLHLWYDVIFDQSLPLTKAGAAMHDLEDVEILEYIPQVKSLAMDPPFDDPRLPEQWHYQNFGEGDQYAEGCDVNAYRAWTVETGKPEVIVAVNDKGVDYAHEDLADNMWINEPEFHGLPGVDDDENGYVDDIYGFSFMTLDGTNPIGKITPGDHGTHVAGTIAAVNNNGIGVGGVAGGDGTSGSGVRIMVDQTLDDQKNGSLTPASFVYAADNGAVLMNCSWGFTNNETPTPQSYMDAIDYFNAYAGLDENGNQVGPMIGGLMIFAAGNDGVEVSHPAMEENVFAVAALSANYVRSYFTSFGEWVDISAPGGDAHRSTFVLSTIPDNQYGNMQGSSMAAPHVTGVAALIVSHYGVGHKGFTRDKLIYLLQSTANKKALEENGSYATRLGAGLVDAYAALIAETPSVAPAPVTDLEGTSRANFISLEWTIPGSEDVPVPYSFNIYYSTSPLTNLDPDHLPDNVSVTDFITRGKPVGTRVGKVLDDLAFDKTYYFRIASVSLMGDRSPLSPEISVTTGHNSAPVITPLDGTSITLHLHEIGKMRFQIADPDGHPMTFRLAEEMRGITVSQEDEDIVVLSINARNAGAGTYQGTLQVSDSFDTSLLPFTVTVLENHPPKVISTLDDHIFSALSLTETYDLSKVFQDIDGEQLHYTITSSAVSIIVDTEIKNETLTVTAHSYGQTTLTITASDESATSASTSFRILVRNGDGKTEVYPNPFKDYLNIRTGNQTNLTVKLISSLGNVVFSDSVEASPFDPARLDLRSVAAGVYTLQLGDKEVFTVVKQ